MNQEEQVKKMQKVIAKAWADEAFKQKLITQPAQTLKDEGLVVPPEVELKVVECTDKVLYIVLPAKPAADVLCVDVVESRDAAWHVSTTCVGPAGCT